MESNDSPEIPDRGETSEMPSLALGLLRQVGAERVINIIIMNMYNVSNDAQSTTKIY